MRKTHRLVLGRLIGIAALFWMILPMFSVAAVIVIRHDRSDADALRLGKPFDAVGRILPDGGCTLIAPNWAVTAAHVAASIRPNAQIMFGDEKHAVKRTILHPEGVGPAGMPPEVDLALVELAEPVKRIKPVELYRGRKELGQTLYIVGYGDYGNPSVGLTRTDGQRRAVTNVVNDAGPRRIFLRFDEPPNGSDFEGVGAPGDSGGPALLQEFGKLYLAGVSSASMNGKPGQYGVTDVYTRVSSQIAWIEKTIKQQ